MSEKHHPNAGRLGLDADGESTGSMQAAELKMREALGLNGRGDRPAPRQQNDQPRQGGDRPMGDRPNGNGHRHRFVQDGEVPVVMAKHNGQGGTAGQVRSGGAPVPTNRLAALSAELGLERNARERAERGLQQVQTMLRDLQTKLAHVDLARTEALAASRADQETLATLRATMREQLELARASVTTERRAREAAEAALQAALAAAAAPAKREPKPVVPRLPTVKKVAAPRKMREPKPVRWWIRSEPAAKS